MTFAHALPRYRWQLLAVLLLVAAIYSRIVPAMVLQWYSDENYSHGFIVPLVAAYIVYVRKRNLADAHVAPWTPGLVVVILALLQLLVGWLGAELFTTRSSLIVLLAGIILFLFGRQVFGMLLLPLCYLFFMIPIPYIIYDAVAFPLKLLISRISVAFLKVLGVVVLREGNMIMFPSTTLEVADACSGTRSLLSLLALAVAYAYFVRTTWVRRALIIASAIPIAIATNAVRVIITGILAQWWGGEAAEGFFHEFAGLAVFSVALLLLVCVGMLAKGRSR